MKAKKFILTSFLFLVLLFGGYFSLFVYQLGAPVHAEWWLSNVYQYKAYRAASIHTRKIIVIGGSNGLFGIDSALLEEKTKLPVLNLSAHGELPLEFMYYKIKKYIKTKDIVVMPLEFEYYYRNSRASDWFSVNMMAWGREYLDSLSVFEYLKFFVTARPAAVLEGAREKISGTASKLESQGRILEELNSVWNHEGTGWNGYSHLSLTPYGDINVDSPVIFSGTPAYGLDRQPPISDNFVKIYQKINTLVSANQASLFLTWPVTLRSSSFDLSSEDSREQLDVFSEKLKSRGLAMQCNPVLFNLDRRFFFDTLYHTNISGARIRTENLAYCLNRKAAGYRDSIPDDTARQRTLDLEQEYSLLQQQ